MNDSYNLTLNRTFQMPFQFGQWFSNPYNIAMVVFYSLVISVAIVGNILACTAIIVSPNLRKNISVFFVFSLALSDLCTACFSMPFDLESFVTNGWWNHSESLCSLWTAVYLITVPTSMWSLFALGLARYKMLKNPWDRFRASPFLTPQRAIFTILVLWGFCLAIALIPILEVKYLPNAVMYGYCIFNISPLYANLISFLSFYFPIFGMCFIYYKVYTIASKQYVTPTGLEKVPNTATKESAVPSQLFVHEVNGEETATETNSHVNNNKRTDTDVTGKCFYHRCLELNKEDKVFSDRMATECNERKEIENISCENAKSKDSDSCPLKNNTNKIICDGNTDDSESNNKWGEQERNTTQRAPLYDHKSCSFQPDICGNNIRDDDCSNCLSRQTSFKLHISVGENNSNGPINESVIQDTYKCKSEKVMNRGPQLAVAKVAPSTSGISKWEPDRITICPLHQHSSDVSNYAIVHSTCSLDVKSKPKFETNDALSSSKNVLKTILAKKRKIFVKNKKAARTIAVIISTFILCWMPFTTLSVILNICKQCYSKNVYHTSQVFLLLGYMNSAMNPIIFSYKDEHFLKSYRKIFKTLFPCFSQTH